MYAVTPPVVDYERMKRVFPQMTPKPVYINFYTGMCLFFIIVGILVLIKRYRDKQSNHYYNT
jgi:hypothetical protein